MALDLTSLDFASATWIIGGAIFGIVGLFLYIVYAASIREKSFEEVLEEQKRRTQQEELQQKQEKIKKDKEKKHKKWGKKSKEKPDLATEVPKEMKLPLNQQSQAPMDIPDIEIIEPKEVVVKKKSKLSPKQSHVSSATTQNKDVGAGEKIAKGVTESDQAVQQENAERISTKEKEKPALEGKPKLENQKVMDSKKPKPTEAEKTSPEATAAPISIQVSPVISSSAPSKKKKKVEQSDKSEDVVHMTASKLISLIKDAILDDDDNQRLIDALLNKQKESSGWKKTGEVQSGAKKQLREKEVALENEQRQKQAITLKYQQELTQEKSKASAQERMLKENISTLQQENQTLSGRVKKVQEELATEKEAAQEKAQQLEKSLQEKADAAIKKIQDEKFQLTKTIKRLESESKGTNATAELEKMKKAKDDLQRVHALLVDEHTLLVSTHKSDLKNLQAQLSDYEKDLQKSSDKNAQLLKEMESLRKQTEDFEATKTALEKELKAMGNSSKSDMEQVQASLEDLKQRYQALEKENQSLSTTVKELMDENKQLASNIEKLQSENERLSAELAASNERVAGDGQEMLQQNGEMNGKVKEDLESISIENEKTLREKEYTIKQLHTNIADLNKELEQQKQKNNELREKNWKAMEALKSEEKASEQKIQEVEKLAEKKVKELEEKLLEGTGRETNVADQIKGLYDTLDQAQDKFVSVQKESISNYQKYESQIVENNHLTSKLIQVQQLAEKLKADIQSMEASTQSCLQRLFSSVSVEESLPYNEWLVQFEKQASSMVGTSTCSQEEVDELQARLSAAIEEQQDLKQKNSHYVTCLAEMEEILQKLQDSAKNQEIEFSEKLKVREQELEKALGELEILRKEKGELISQLQEIETLQQECSALQTELESYQNNMLEQKYEEVNKNYINLKDQIDNKDKRILELQKEIASVDSLKKELEDIKSKLEKEKKINKDFSSQMIKLNSLVKIGQDALQAEQENVKKLQSQLQAEKLATANGTSSPTITADSELQAKKLQTEKPKKSKKSDASGKK